MSIPCAALMCHAPIVIPALGGSRGQACSKTTTAMRKVAKEVLAHKPEVIVVISPHAPRAARSWAVVHDAEIAGTFSRFGRTDLGLTLEGAPHAAQALSRVAQEHGLSIEAARGDDLDHGALVPLMFLTEAGFSGRVLILSLPYPGTDQEERFGHIIAQAAASCGERWAIIASGDMSHRLTGDAPAGFHPRAKEFDLTFVKNLRQKDLRAATSVDPRLQALVAEDVVQSTRVAAAAVGYVASGLTVYSYEGPFGVGYCEAMLFSERAQDRAADVDSPPPRLVDIAHDAIVHALAGTHYQVPELAAPWDAPHAVFVTLRSPDGELRGCIGRTEPVFRSLALEVADCAVAAATRDHRMPPVEKRELTRLGIEISVLEPPESIADASKLDPKRFGLVVSQGERRGVLLPEVEGVDTVDDQLRIAMRKGEISVDGPYRLERFRVHKVRRSQPG